MNCQALLGQREDENGDKGMESQRTSRDPTSLPDAEAALLPHVVDFQGSHDGPATRLDLFLDPNTKRVPW